MCRSTDSHHGFGYFAGADKDTLKLKAFHLRLFLVSKTKTKAACSNNNRSRLPLSLPESLTLVYLPRISGSVLQIDNSKVRSDTPAFITLHRVVAAGGSEVAYGSRERVKAGEGVRFEVYLNEEKILKGVFRKDLYSEENWNVDCKSALEKELPGVAAAEVAVEVQGHPAAEMVERVEMVVKRKRKGRELFEEMEEIPEETEVDENESDETCSCCCEDHQDCNEEEDAESIHEGEEMEMEMEVEGVRWAVDVGIWVMCLGVGFLVTKASSRSLRRRRLL